MNRSNVTAQAAGIVLMATIFTKLIGFFREILIAKHFGAGLEADAYIVASGLPVILFVSMGAAISTSFLPLFSKKLEEEGEKSALMFGNSIINFSLLFTAAVSIICIIMAPIIVRIMAPNFSGEAFSLTVKLSRVMFPILVFIFLSSVETSILHSFKRFTVPAFISIPYNFIIIFYLIFLTDKFGVLGLAAATLMGWVSQFIVQLPFLAQVGYRYRLKLNLRDKDLIGIVYLSIPIIIGTTVQQLNTLVDRALASGLEEGSIAALSYANKMYFISAMTFVVAIRTVIYPKLCSLYNQDKIKEFLKNLDHALRMVIYILLPFVVLMIVLRKPIIQLVFERGQFDSRSTYLTSIAFLFYSIGAIGFGVQEIINRGFYAMGDTKTPMIIGGITIGINIILNIILVRIMGIGGIALATSISSIILAIWLLLLLQKKIGRVLTRKSYILIVKMIVSVTLCGIVSILISSSSTSVLGNTLGHRILITFSSALGGITVYGLSTILLKCEEPILIINTFREIILNTFINKGRN